MALQELRLTPWNEKDRDKPEEFKVFKSCRINCEDGHGAKAYQKGDKVTVFGNTKKDLYFQNKIMYPKDFDAVVAYENEMKTSFETKPEAESDAAAEGFVKKKK